MPAFWEVLRRALTTPSLLIADIASSFHKTNPMANAVLSVGNSLVSTFESLANRLLFIMFIAVFVMICALVSLRGILSNGILCDGRLRSRTGNRRFS